MAWLEVVVWEMCGACAGVVEAGSSLTLVHGQRRAHVYLVFDVRCFYEPVARGIRRRASTRG